MSENVGRRGGDVFHCLDFYVLPEECITAVITLTSPRDACRLSTVSKIFHSAANSDSVWECFLPSDYQTVIDRAEDGDTALLNSLSKKQLYHRLADQPLLVDGGTKSFWIEKLSGKKCYMIAARSLDIVWGDTPRYWNWISISESRFPEVAELITVCWLDIRGKMKMSMLSARTNYAVYFVFKLTEEVFGFHDPAEVSVGIARGKTETRSVFLDPDEDQRQMFFPIDTHIPSMPRRGDDQYPKQRSDGWLETKMGEFFVEEDDNGEVELSVLEIKGGDWKGGLIVEGFEIRTKAAE